MKNSEESFDVIEEALFDAFGDEFVGLSDLQEKLLIFAEKSNVQEILTKARSREEKIAHLSRLLTKYRKLFF